MRVLIECPFCENRREIAQSDSSKKVKCNLCKNVFDAATNQVQQAPPKASIVTQAQAPQPQSPPVARPVTNPAPVAKPILTPVTETETPVASTGAPISTDSISTDPISTDSISTGISRSTKKRALLKRKRSLAGPIIMGIAVLASAVALIVVLANLPKDKKQTARKDSSEVVKEGDAPAETTNTTTGSEKASASSSKPAAATVFRDGGVSDEVVEPPTNAPPDKPPKLSTFRGFNSEEVEDFWRKNHNYMVRLKVDLGATSHYVSGTIIDRRGWVVTSLSGVKNAREIEVQNAAKDLRAFNGVVLESTDSVRGVLAKDPAHDLVVLLINRELVRSLSEVKRKETDFMVDGVKLIQYSAPSTQNFAWPKEVQVGKRREFDELDFDFRTQIEDLKFNPDLDYIIHDGFAHACVGAPLLNPEGRLLGINSSINDKSKNVLLIPSEAITALLSTVTGNPDDISTLSR